MSIRRGMTICTLLIVIAVSSGLVAAQSVTPEQMLKQIFTAEAVSGDWFSPAFLAQVPVAQLNDIIRQYRAALGALEDVQGNAPVFKLTFSKGYVTSQIVLDSAGRVAGFFLGPPEPRVSGLDSALDGFRELPGKVSVLVVSQAGVLAALNPELPLAVGSAFKLAVLAALKDQIAAGALAWDDVATLEAGHISLPSGILQSWPAGSPLTLHTLASLMISVSDNTATDALIALLGRELVEKYTALNHPLLTTREAFALKNPANGDHLKAYRQGDTNQRRGVLKQLQSLPLPDAGIFIAPQALDIEWFFSAQELVNLMAAVQDLSVFDINPGVASPADWQHIAFKGGSEPGAINLTTWLVGHSGMNYCVAATWNNDKALDEVQFVGLYSGILRQLAEMDAK